MGMLAYDTDNEHGFNDAVTLFKTRLRSHFKTNTHLKAVPKQESSFTFSTIPFCLLSILTKNEL